MILFPALSRSRVIGISRNTQTTHVRQSANLWQVRARLSQALLDHISIDLAFSIVNKIGFVPFSKQGANMLFTFVSQCYLQDSLLVTTNLAFAEWSEDFGNALSVGPLLNLLTHRRHIV